MGPRGRDQGEGRERELLMSPSSQQKQEARHGSSLVVQWLGLCALTAEGPGSIPGQGTKIPQAAWHSQKKKKEMRSKTYNYQTDHKYIKAFPWDTPLCPPSIYRTLLQVESSKRISSKSRCTYTLRTEGCSSPPLNSALYSCLWAQKTLEQKRYRLGQVAWVLLLLLKCPGLTPRDC